MLSKLLDPGDFTANRMQRWLLNSLFAPALGRGAGTDQLYCRWIAVLIVAAAAAGIMAVQGCRPKPVEWTVMVYLNGDNNIEAEALEDFRNLAAAATSSKVNVVVQIDRAEGGESDDYGDWTQALRFHLNSSVQPVPADAKEDLGEINMGDGAELRKFVVWAAKHYPAKRYCLVLSSHGRGWLSRLLVKNEKLPLSLRAQRERALENLKLNFPELARDALAVDEELPAGLLFHSLDSKPEDRLYNREIADALSELPGGVRIDVLGMDACLMGMVENAYAFRRIADIFVASEEWQSISGWKHDAWLRALVSNPAMSAEELGTEMVNAYGALYGTKHYATLSAVRLAHIDALAAATNELALAMIMSMPGQFTAICDARSKCGVYGAAHNKHNVDLGYFCEKIREQTTNVRIRTAAGEVLAQLEIGKAIVKRTAGELRGEGYGSYGLAIYFPSSVSQYLSDPDAYGYMQASDHFPVEFVKTMKWDEFLRDFLMHSCK